MNVLIVSFLAFQAVGAFDKVLLFRTLNTNDLDMWTCAAEDNGDAFVWNTLSRTKRDTGFSSEYNETSLVNCRSNYKHCNWNAQKPWEQSSSSTIPMGLVLDSEWEDFREFDNFRNRNTYNHISTVYVQGAFAFSLRGESDCDFFLCNNNLTYSIDFCYWITIGVHKSVIRSCPNGIYNCRDNWEATVEMDKGLTPTEWSHFVLRHNIDNVTLYDNEKMLLMYRLDHNVKDRAKNTNAGFFYVYYTSVESVFLRYHLYNFLHTCNKSLVLKSPAIKLKNNTFCLRLSVALCATCSMEMHLFHKRGTFYNESLVKVDGKPTIHGLPAWQRVNARMTVNRKVKESLTIQITLKNKDFYHPGEGFWAVRDITECPLSGSKRVSIMTQEVNTANETRRSQEEKVTCQRISYNRNEVVAFTQPMSTSLDDYSCPKGPLCSISCNDFNEQFDKDCKNVAICDWRGCTCNVGFTGEMCNSYCGYNQYGYACKETCGKCMGKQCDFKTGLCPTCNNGNDVFYVPPYCKIEIEKPPKPTIKEINETCVHVSVKLPKKYDTTLEYTFVESRYNKTQKDERYRLIDPNTEILTSDFGNLEVATLYSFFCRLRVKEADFVIDGHPSEFITRCNDIFFKITPGERNLTITKNEKESFGYSCPLRLYRWSVLRGNITVIQENELRIPYTPREKLQPGTLYKVIIKNQLRGKTFEFNVTTIEGVPSMVQNLTSTVSDNLVKLQWEPSEKPNGKIVNYEVTLRILNYMGCRNKDGRYSIANKKNPDNQNMFLEETQVVFSNLRLYTEYNATVYAWNSKRGEGASVVFVTCDTKIPRSKYTNLKLSNKTLVWDLPEDCLTITGEIKATRLIFTNGNNKENITTDIINRSLNIDNVNLYADETYKVFAYVLRGISTKHNDSAYAEYVFKTRPKAPPKVRQLEIFQLDLSKKLISFRWKKPYPPNGQLDSYFVCVISLKGKKSNCSEKGKLPKDDYCPFWEDYNCANKTVSSIPFHQLCVYAKNQNVSANGALSCVDYKTWKNESDPPGNVTVRMFKKHKVELSWLHPWKTGFPLEKFHIVANLSDTELYFVKKRDNFRQFNVTIKQYQAQYTKRLNVLPSTLYTFFVFSMNPNGEISERNGSASIMTPASIGFEPKNLTYNVHSDNTTCIRVPKIVNSTKTSNIYFIIKGNYPCKEHKDLSRYLKERANVKDYETAWLAASFLVNNYTAEEFCIGDNEKAVANCPLRKDEFYTVIVMIDVGKNSTSDETAIKYIYFGVHPKRHDEKWIIPLVVILLIFIIICYSYRRWIQKILRQYAFYQNLNIAYNCQEKRITRFYLPKSECNSTRDITDIAPPLIEMSQDYDDLLMPIKVKDFEDYVKQAISNGSLDDQYEMLPRGLTKSCYYGQLPENKSKNRYRNLMPYDETRVVLKKLQDDPFSDYINANYITGYKKEKRYIATQGPKANTVIDFWRMVWQENVLVICMLASVYENGKTKCEQYWPDIGKEKKYGDVMVLNFKQEVFTDYTFRTLHVTCDDETRQVKHLHYTTWPDHGVPTYTYSVVTYLKKLLAIQIGNGPVVVHCSAGVGRTGTIILCDICLRRAAVEQVVDVLSEIRKIRNQRVNMVDNKEQYLFAHLLLIECLLALPSSLPCNDTLRARIGDMKSHLHVQLQRIEDTSWQDDALKSSVCQPPLSERNMAKNRYPELVSKKAKRIYLNRYSIHDEDSDYIAGVYVDGLKVQRQYLASQLPLPSTFGDFWRMIAELKVELIVMLQCPDPNDPTCCPVVPTDNEFQPTPYITVIARNIKEEKYYVYHKLLLIDNSKTTTTKQPITILRPTKWLPGRNRKPPAEAALVALWQAAERISRVEIPTVVLCHDGVTGCGLYLALSFLLERMTIEKECDVCLAIRLVKRSRPDFVRSVEQMEYLYNAALAYIENCTIYANLSKN